MASDAPRRRPSSGAARAISNTASTSAPQQKSAAPTKSAFSRFFGATSRAPAEVPKLTSGYVTSRFLNRPNPSASQWAQLDTGSALSALAYNDDRTHAILAGDHVLQTVYVNDKSCTKEFDLREAWARKDGQKGDRPNPNVDIHCVKWSHGWGKDYIAGAGTGGKVIVYDLAHHGSEYCRLQEHFRKVHTIAFNPFEGHLLLSGSLDSCVRLWDLKARNEGLNITPKSRRKFVGGREGVQDVKWSPRDGYDFALGTESGEIQVWDSRQHTQPKFRINAHDSVCTAVDWHPDGKHLLSAGMDQNVKVWNTLTDVRRSTPKWSLRTPYPIKHARWRPPCLSLGSQESKGLQQSTMVATSYDRRALPVVHVWDFRRPHIPFRVLDEFQSGPADMIWHSQDLLWTVGREGLFTQSDVTYALRPIEERPRIPFAVSPHGEIIAFRGNKVKSHHASTLLPREMEKKSPVNPGASRGPFDDSLDESFLMSSYKPHHTRRPSNRSAKSASSTPPSAASAVNLALTRNEDLIVHFDVVMADQKKARKPKQSSFRGQLHGITDPLVTMYIARKLQIEPLNNMSELEMILRLAVLLERNAIPYERASLHRQAQTWRMLSSVLVAHLQAPFHKMIQVSERLEPDPWSNGDKFSGTRYGMLDNVPFREVVACNPVENGKPASKDEWRIVDDGGIDAVNRSGASFHLAVGEVYPLARLMGTDMLSQRSHHSVPQPTVARGVSTSEVSTPRAIPYPSRSQQVPELTLPASLIERETLDTNVQVPHGVSRLAEGESPDARPKQFSESNRDNLGSTVRRRSLEAFEEAQMHEISSRPQSPSSGQGNAAASSKLLVDGRRSLLSVMGRSTLPTTVKPDQRGTRVDDEGHLLRRGHDEYIGGSNELNVKVGGPLSSNVDAADNGTNDLTKAVSKNKGEGLRDSTAQSRVASTYDVASLAGEATTTLHRFEPMSSAAGLGAGDPAPLIRHDSNDSFALSFTSSDDGGPAARSIESERGDSFTEFINGADKDQSSYPADASPSVQNGIQIPAPRHAISQTIGDSQYSDFKRAPNDQQQSFTTDGSTDYSSGPSFSNTHRNVHYADLEASTIKPQTGNDSDATKQVQQQAVDEQPPSRLGVEPLQEGKALHRVQDKYPFLRNIVHPSTNRQIGEEEMARLVGEAASFLPPSAEDRLTKQILSRLSSSDFRSKHHRSHPHAMVDLEQLRAQLQHYYTQTLPDAQMLEAINRILDAVLGQQTEPHSPEHEAAVWLTYFEQLHRNGQHTIANRLAGTVHARASVLPIADTEMTGLPKATITDWPNSTMTINCSRCDKPANSGICSKCSQVLGQCTYCWQRDSPYDWPPKIKKQRDTEIFPLADPTRPSDEQGFEPVYTSRAPGAVGPQGLWSFCMSCNHGLHAGCREQRRKEALLKDRWTLCPIAGCDCECVPSGKDVAPVPEVVATDDRKAEESKAVRGVGKLLDNVQTSGKRVGFVLGD